MVTDPSKLNKFYIVYKSYVNIFGYIRIFKLKSVSFKPKSFVGDNKVLGWGCVVKLDV